MKTISIHYANYVLHFHANPTNKRKCSDHRFKNPLHYREMILHLIIRTTPFMVFSVTNPIM